MFELSGTICNKATRSGVADCLDALKCKLGLLGAECNERLDADGVENLLQSGYRHGLVFRLFIPADDLFTDAEPARKFSLRHTLGNSHLRDKGCDLIQSFDVRQS